MLNREDKAKLAKSEIAVLEALKNAGPKGLTTWELPQVTGYSRAVARVWALTQVGHVITKERLTDDRITYRYVWKGYNADGQLLLFTKAA